MRRLRELACVILGHDWEIQTYPPHLAYMFRWCGRCYRREPNL